jgi:hypothetical protein
MELHNQTILQEKIMLCLFAEFIVKINSRRAGDDLWRGYGIRPRLICQSGALAVLGLGAGEHHLRRETRRGEICPSYRCLRPYGGLRAVALRGRDPRRRQRCTSQRRAKRQGKLGQVSFL